MNLNDDLEIDNLFDMMTKVWSVFCCTSPSKPIPEVAPNTNEATEVTINVHVEAPIEIPSSQIITITPVDTVDTVAPSVTHDFEVIE